MSADTARLFIGLELNEDARSALDGVRNALVESGAVGKFHPAALYHLTLCFLGNTPVEAIPHIGRLMDSVSSAPFSLTLSSLGSFKGGSILWAGVQPSPALMNYQAHLAAALRLNGFPLEEGEYRPHITLARQVKPPVPGIAVPPVSFRVHQSTLFHRTRVNGALSYIPIYRSVFR